MRLTLAVPDLMTLEREALAASKALGLVAHYSPAPVIGRGSLDALLLPSFAQTNASLAPLAALGAGFDPKANYILRADPVSLVAGRSDVTLGARIDDLEADDCVALQATLNAHFGGDGLGFHAPRPDAWFVVVERTPDITTTALSLVHGAIYPYLPAGNDAPRWRRWLSEMQMLMHEHPANAAREKRGCAPVTGIWISDGGRLAEAADVITGNVFAAPGAAGDVARGIARQLGIIAGNPPANFAALPPSADAVVILHRAEPTNLGYLERDWLAPAVAALEGGALTNLTLLADGHGIAATWRAQRPAWIRRALAKFRSPQFTPPLHRGKTKGDDS